MRALLAACVFLVSAGCGGSTFTAADASAGGDGGSDDGASDAPADDGGGADAHVDCRALSLRMDQLRHAARQCCPTCKSLQCTVTVDDLCCPFTGNASNQAAIDELGLDVQAYRAACGPINCPAIPCAPVPSNECDSNTSLCK